jgi:hypothetical protein
VPRTYASTLLPRSGPNSTHRLAQYQQVGDKPGRHFYEKEEAARLAAIAAKESMDATGTQTTPRAGPITQLRLQHSHPALAWCRAGKPSTEPGAPARWVPRAQKLHAHPDYQLGCSTTSLLSLRCLLQHPAQHIASYVDMPGASLSCLLSTPAHCSTCQTVLLLKS